VKRSQLATPAGIDHDFNFLSGIERAFETADRDAVGRGIGVEGEGTARRRHNGPTKGSNLQRGLAASGAIIRKAPVGMSRQKANKTQYNGKCVISTSRMNCTNCELKKSMSSMDSRVGQPGWYKRTWTVSR